MTRAARIRPTLARRALLVLAIACVAVLVFAAPALAKSYTMPKVAIRAQLQANGDMLVTENRTFDFSGDYTFAYWQLATKGSQGIDVLGVSMDGVPLKATTDATTLDSRPEGYYLVQQLPDEVDVHAFHRTSNASRTFQLRYLVKGAVQRYTDCANLVWQFVGDKWGVGVGDLAVAIKPPSTLTRGQVQAWAHGPLTGVVAIQDDGTVTLAVKNLPAQTFVEADVLYPPTAFPAAPQIDQAMRAQIQQREAALANAANAQRLQARAFVGFAIGGPALAAILALAISIWAFYRYGREYKGSYPGGYFREDPRPDLHPAVIGALWRFGTVEDSDIAAALMDLANRKVVAMQPVKVQHAGFLGLGGETDTYQLTIDPAKRQGLPPLDSELVALVFDTVGGGSGTVTLEDLKTYAKAHAETFSSAVKDWKALAAAEAENQGFFEGGQGRMVGMFLAAAVVVGLGIWAAIGVGSLWPAVIPVLCAIPMVVIAPNMTKRSKAGNELYLQYKGLRDYLRDFSRLNEAPPMSVILWERFLVVAVVFGIADEVIEAMRVKVPDVVRDPQFQTTYWWVYGFGTGNVSPVSALSGGFTSASQVATSAMSSAAGGGGGFSGGGGFGGGGGGGGAG